MIKLLLLPVILSIFSLGEVTGMILNKDKLLIPKTQDINSTKVLQKKVTEVLNTSKSLKEVSIRYLKLSVFYKEKLLNEIKATDRKIKQDDIEFIQNVLEDLNLNINKIKKILRKEEEKVKKLEDNFENTLQIKN